MKKTALTLLAAALFAAPVFAENAQKNTPPQTASGQEQDKIERNKANAIAFYDLAFNQHKPSEAARLYLGNPYWQHNPGGEDGAQAFIDGVTPFVQANPQSSSDIKRAIAEGDWVVLHVHSRLSPQDRGNAVVDIFRFDENGKIVEHWDVVQPVPEKTASGRTMF